MKPPRHRDDSDRFDVKMTPMIDIVFLLLIFFVCTASFQKLEEVLPTNLSLAGSVESQTAVELPPDVGEVIVKVLMADGQVSWDVNGRAFVNFGDVQAVLMGLGRAKRDIPVILDVAGEVPLSYAIDLYDVCRLAGFEKIQFAAAV